MQRRQDENDENAALFDRQRIADYLGFVKGSLRRHSRVAGGVFATTMALVLVALAVLPKSYHVEAKLLAQRSQVLVVRGDGPDAGVAPTRGAAETIGGRDNLLAIIHSTDLVNHYREHRSISQKVIQGVMHLLPHKQETEADKEDAMVQLLEKQMTVWVNDATVSIAIDWPDAEMACRLVDAAQQNFLAVRHAQEVDALAESIAILTGHGARLKADIDVEVAALADLRADKHPAATSDASATPAPATGAVAMPLLRPAPKPAHTAEVSPEHFQLGSAIGAKQRAIDELEDLRRRRLAEVQTRLAEQRAIYTDSHPTIVDLKQTIATLSGPSPQVASMRAELAGMKDDYNKHGAEAVGDAPAPAAVPMRGFGTYPVVATTPPPLPNDILRLDGDLREDRDPALVYARGRLRDAMDKYALLRSQVQASQIDLETAQAAFKYRYSVVMPAQLPRSPMKPSVPLVLISGLFAAAFVALVLVVWLDIRSGRLIERWQIERLLDQPILGEMGGPRLASAAKR